MSFRFQNAIPHLSLRDNGDTNSMSTHHQEFGERANCPNWRQNNLALAIANTLNLVSGKWKIHILGQIILGPVRYNKLNRLLPQMSSKVLTQQLQALERDALIYREYHNTMGKHVNYAITPLGARAGGCRRYQELAESGA